jgi:Tol biopolymer transport system component
MLGRTIAHYRITDRIGAGGMGEVYRARDSRLERDVALKVLPDVFAGDPERLMRFEREARLLASLKHANIATIHGIEQDGNRRVLVMELVEGEDLAQRVARGPLPQDEAIAIARRIADALEAAHEQGVVHRDLKPANVVVTPDGDVKVLDFGLAKAVEGDASSSGLSQSPTLLASSPTAAGVILGTAAYMSPEQARGKRVDRRADIFAFGCVLYEMLCGRQAFGGETVSDTLAAVLRAEPDWSGLPANTYAPVRALLRRCLEKDPRQRLRDIGEARIVLDAVARGETGEPATAAAAAPSRGIPRMVWVLSALLLACAAGWFVSARRVTPVESRLVRASIAIPDSTPLAVQGAHPAPPAVSPDGRYVAFGVETPGGTLLALRELAGDEIRLMAGTDGVGYPFWSPDNRQIGFFAGGKLKRIEITGGAPVTICDAEVGKGGTWREDGLIVFAPSYATAIFRVPATGGTPEAITQLDTTRFESSHRFPRFLPDGEHFIYVVRNFGGDTPGGHTLRVASVDGRTSKDLFATESDATYALGYVFFVREGMLIAQPFDTGALALSGDPVTIASSVRLLSGAAHGTFDVSQGGVLAYQRGEDTSTRQLLMLDASGREAGPVGGSEPYSIPVRFSPDGTMIVTGLFNSVGGTADLWLIDVARGTKTRFTFDPAHDSNQMWAPDGTRVAFTSGQGGAVIVYTKPVEGNAPETRAIQSDFDLFPVGWSPDGRYLLCHELGAGEQGRLRAFSLDGDAPDPLAGVQLPQSLRGVQGLYQIAFSPDGKWLAFESAEGGRMEIYAIPFGTPGRRWQITIAGGTDPRWAGRHLYFTRDRVLWRIPVEPREAGLVTGDEERVYDAHWADDYDVTRDESRIVVLVGDSRAQSEPISLILNWTEALR